MFKKILIANRGEIACRVAATARRLGIQTVAVYSDADAGAKHVAACDEAIRIGPPPAQDSYLCIDRIIDAALATGAQAIHPGYGFLSENDAFADACRTAGLVFIGPPPSAIRAMGSKSAAKALMEQAQIPLVPGYHGDDQDAVFLRAQADRIGYPVLLKPSAGGGGKGMHIVEKTESFEAALAACKREALSSFGDDKVLIEKYLARSRHIEIQVFADTSGNCVHLFERDCSVQRRHQKVLEEAPAPGMTSERRRVMGQAAVAAAQAVGYVGAGTVEFIVDMSGDEEEKPFYFMEMNTRLQVEHPVTEMITGIDLVEWQLRIAAGEPLPLRQAELAIHGHAIEARIYAENPLTDFLPSVGTLRHMRMPAAATFATNIPSGQTAAVRIDSGVREGDAISSFYDPMIAKLIVWGSDRHQALARMSAALSSCEIAGVATNVSFLGRLVESVPFAEADLDTGLIERHRRSLLSEVDDDTVGKCLPFAVVALLQQEQSCATPDPWSRSNGWRLNQTCHRMLRFTASQTNYVVDLEYARDGIHAQSGLFSNGLLAWKSDADRQITITLAGKHLTGSVFVDGKIFHVFHQGATMAFEHIDALAHAGQAEAEGGRLTAPMSGKIAAVLVKQGDNVKKGMPLLIMEAMKMEHTIAAPADGVVEEVLYSVGDQVADGGQLLRFKAA